MLMILDNRFYSILMMLMHDAALQLSQSLHQTHHRDLEEFTCRLFHKKLVILIEMYVAVKKLINTKANLPFFYFQV